MLEMDTNGDRTTKSPINPADIDFPLGNAYAWEYGDRYMSRSGLTGRYVTSLHGQRVAEKFEFMADLGHT